MFPDLADMDTWQAVETGPFLEVDISSLEPQSMYAVRVSAKGMDGKIWQHVWASHY